jgi:hypothetical protein
VARQFLLGNSGVGQVGEGEVADEAAATGLEVFQVGADKAEQQSVGDEGALRGGGHGGGTGVDPAFEEGDLLLVQSGAFGRRHLPVADALQQDGLAGVAGDDPVAGDEAVAVEDVVEAPLAAAAGTVAVAAAQPEQFAGAHREVVRPANSRDAQAGQSQAEGVASRWGQTHDSLAKRDAGVPRLPSSPPGGRLQVTIL